MNKNLFKILVCTVLAMTMLGGCAEKAPVEAPKESAPVVTEAPAEKSTEQLNAEAEQAYMAFLNGEMSVTTSEKYQENDGGYYYDGALNGTYSYDELKSAIKEYDEHGSATKYAFVDFGQDGVNELVLRLDNTEPSFFNWVGIIKYNGEGLDLNYFYVDGGRTYSVLYSSGYLQVGGSMGAGASVSTLVGFDENGFGSNIFSVCSLFGTFVENAVYDLRTDGNGLSGNYDDIAGVSALEVSEYLANGTVKLSVSGWSEDAAIRGREEELIGELEALGAEVVSEEEMEALSSITPYEAPEVIWSEWNSGEDAMDESAGENGDIATISISYPSEEFLAQSQAFNEFIAEESEYQVKVELSTDVAVTNFRVLNMYIQDIGDDGTLMYNADELYTLETLTPEKPLVVGMVFVGDIPNMGISYVDANGVERLYAIAMSGEDGSPLLVDAELMQ